MDEIQNVSKQICFNSLTYYFKGESGSKHFTNFKSALAFHRNIKVGYITLGRVVESQKKLNQRQMGGMNQKIKKVE